MDLAEWRCSLDGQGGECAFQALDLTPWLREGFARDESLKNMARDKRENTGLSKPENLQEPAFP